MIFAVYTLRLACKRKNTRLRVAICEGYMLYAKAAHTFINLGPVL